MSRILLVYASKHGQTFAVASHVAQRLRTAGHAVDVVDAASRPPAPDSYDLAIVGACIELARHSAYTCDYVLRHRAALAAMPTAFFSVSMSAAQPDAGRDPHGYMEKTFTQVGWHPDVCEAFGGALRYRQYGWLTRFALKQMAKRAGHSTDTSRDHVFTDFAAVTAFADRLADRLGTASAARA